MTDLGSTLSLETGMTGAKGAIHCLQCAVKPCLGAYVRQHMQLEASISPEHVTLGHIHQEIPPETSCSGIEPSVWQKILWYKENHSLLLKCFITLIEYPYQKGTVCKDIYLSLMCHTMPEPPYFIAEESLKRLIWGLLSAWKLMY